MTSTGERIRQARKEKRYTQQQLADLAGVDRTLIVHYEQGKVQVPEKKLKLLAKHLNRTVAWFFEEESEEARPEAREAARALEEAGETLTERQLDCLRDFFRDFRRPAEERSEVGRKDLVRLTPEEREAAMERFAQKAKIHRLPVLEVEQKAAAGPGEFVEVPREYLHLGQHRWQPGYRPFRITGESMAPYILDGDYVVVDVMREPANDDVVLARTPDGLTVKRFFLHRDHVELVSVNPEYQPMRLTEVAILGVLVDIVRPVKKIVDR